MSGARGTFTGEYSDSFTAMAMLPIIRSNGYISMPLYINIFIVGIADTKWRDDAIRREVHFILFCNYDLSIRLIRNLN